MPSGYQADRIRRAATNAADPELKAVAREISLRFLRYLLFKDESHTKHPLFNFHEVKLVERNLDAYADRCERALNRR